jgi:hypothetical protein
MAQEKVKLFKKCLPESKQKTLGGYMNSNNVQRIEVLEKQVKALKKAFTQTGNRESVVEMCLILPKADIGGLHFNRQEVCAVFEKRDDGWYYSRDILFLSARNVDNNNNRDILTEYLNMAPAKNASRGIKGQIAEMMNVSSLDVEIALPRKPQGIKKYNGVDWWYWLADPYAGSAGLFCGVGSGGIAHHNTASSVGGCTPAFCVA